MNSIMKFRVIGLITALFILSLPALCRAESPVIENVELFNFRDLTTPVTEFVIGDEATFTVRFTDPDIDCAYLTISEYFLIIPNPDPSSETTYWIMQDTVTDTINSFPDLDPVEISGPMGDWRIDFRIEDKAGNVSNIFEVFVTIYLLEIPEPIPDPIDDDDSGGGGGGGGCYLSICATCGADPHVREISIIGQ
ncbi:unnamed protein product [marine sediment metagenome]|uniref:Uncharacterized protein n=1 Tax=marine sediment metagenome TaxID=412755 RepID=X1UP21_9ZZZZ